jgi:hypothetical protein
MLNVWNWVKEDGDKLSIYWDHVHVAVSYKFQKDAHLFHVLWKACRSSGVSGFLLYGIFSDIIYFWHLESYYFPWSHHLRISYCLLVSHVLYHICDLNAHWNVYSHIMISHFHYCFMRSSWEDVRNWHINDSLSHNEASHLHHVLHIIGLRVHIVTIDFILLFDMICLLTN